MQENMITEDELMSELSPETFNALKEFMEEQKRTSEINNGPSNLPNSLNIQENWNLSQFWYDEKTCQYLSHEAIRVAGEDGSIALISCPSLYKTLKNIAPKCNVKLFEYDSRFSIYDEDFIKYDYNRPLEVPKDMEKSFDVVMADPPFLSEECLRKTSETIKFLAKDKIILCTGATMANLAYDLLQVKKCDFEPRHERNLANEFYCYKNY